MWPQLSEKCSGDILCLRELEYEIFLGNPRQEGVQISLLMSSMTVFLENMFWFRNKFNVVLTVQIINQKNYTVASIT
jgi:hypothetical protein